MKVMVRGKHINLDKNAFVAQGGEGTIYANGDTAYKIYTNPKKIIQPAKTQELSTLTLNNIIKPLDIITLNKQPVGYTMKFLKNTYPLCQLFTKAFRTRNTISPDDILKLIIKLADIVKHVHEKGILIVDLNEMNFLVSNDFKTPYAIDVDSYQTISFPATAIMESIRDRHCGNKFSEGSDWFSFAIVTFQLFAGIHPYRGKHPTIKDLDERMKQNISVLNPNVSIPKACQDFSIIPDKFITWYKLVLEKGERLQPPTDATAGTTAIITKISGSDNFTITTIKKYDGDQILDFASINGTNFTLGTTGKNGWLHDNRKTNTTWNKLCLAIVPKTKDIIQAWTENGSLKLHNITRGMDIKTNLQADEIMTHDNVLYTKTTSLLVEIEYPIIKGLIMPVTKFIAGIMPNASKMFDGGVLQNMLGSVYAFLVPRQGLCYQVRIQELDGYRIIDAKLDRNVLVTIGFKNGKYDRLIHRFDDDFTTYDVKTAYDVDFHGINFVALDTGVCVIINEKEEIEIFSAQKDTTTNRLIIDPAIDNSMRLYKKGTKVLFTKGKTLYAIETK